VAVDAKYRDLSAAALRAFGRDDVCLGGDGVYFPPFAVRLRRMGHL
jgi:hypothetical protein